MRIAGVTLPDKKHLNIALTSVYGVGRSTAEKILDLHNIPASQKVSDLKEDQENAIRKSIEELNIEGNLRRFVGGNIKRLKDIQSLRGRRHSVGLPVRGQRTQTNARTRKGPKKTMGSGKVKLQKK